MEQLVMLIGAWVGSSIGTASRFFLIGFFLTVGVVVAARWLDMIPNLGIN